MTGAFRRSQLVLHVSRCCVFFSFTFGHGFHRFGRVNEEASFLATRGTDHCGLRGRYTRVHDRHGLVSGDAVELSSCWRFAR
jgi:hypothetical protein